MFRVDDFSDEFRKVQEAFKISPILELYRIQNKPIYKQYYEEKNFLRELNGGQEVREMKLYHGTGSVDPAILYGDKEICFNVNFTNDYNSLGKATYFAEESAYSNDYSFLSSNRMPYVSYYSQLQFK